MIISIQFPPPPPPYPFRGRSRIIAPRAPTLSGRSRINAPFAAAICLLRFTTLFPPFRIFAFATLLLVMASRRTLSSDPEFLLEFMHDLPDESDSDDDFDGYLEPDDGPVAYRREENFEEPERRWSSSRRSRSLESLAETEQGPPLDTESPLASLSPSPSYSPMQGHNASGSPLAATTLAPRYSGTATGASTGCTAAGSSSLSDTAGGSPSLSSQTYFSQVLYNIVIIHNHNSHSYIVHNKMIQYCFVYNIIQPPVFTGSPGVVPEMENRRPIEFFRLFFDEEVLELLHSETRRYTDQYLEREKEHLEQHPQARAH